MDGVVNALKTLFAEMNGWGPYLLAIAGLGTFTMAVLQAIKDTTPLRRWFQQDRMQRWIQAHAGIAGQELRARVDPAKAERQLLLLATDGDEVAFYSLEIEKLCGQWNAAIKVVLDYPVFYPDLFACVAARASRRDFNRVRGGMPVGTLPPGAEAQLPLDEQMRRTAKRQRFVDSRTRVMHQIQRAVDAFQIDTAFRWKWGLQIASFVFSFLFTIIAMALGTQFKLGTAILSAAVAGFLAPVARDLLAVVQKLRGP